MALVNPDTLQVGQCVKFTCNHPTDIVQYEGKIVSISSFSIVKMLEPDLIPYHQEALKMDRSLPPIDKLKFITLEYEQNGVIHRVSRAIEWINVSSLVILDSDLKFDIRIYDRPHTEIATVIDLLNAHGYICSWVNPTEQ